MPCAELATKPGRVYRRGRRRRRSNRSRTPRRRSAGPTRSPRGSQAGRGHRPGDAPPALRSDLPLVRDREQHAHVTETETRFNRRPLADSRRRPVAQTHADPAHDLPIASAPGKTPLAGRRGRGHDRGRRRHGCRGLSTKLSAHDVMRSCEASRAIVRSRPGSGGPRTISRSSARCVIGSTAAMRRRSSAHGDRPAADRGARPPRGRTPARAREAAPLRVRRRRRSRKRGPPPPSPRRASRRAAPRLHATMRAPRAYFATMARIAAALTPPGCALR